MNVLSDFGKRRSQREEGSSAKDFWGDCVLYRLGSHLPFVRYRRQLFIVPLKGLQGYLLASRLLCCLPVWPKWYVLMPGSLGWENWSLHKPVGTWLSQSQTFLWGLGKKFGVGNGAEETSSSWGLCICVPGD